MPTNEKTLRRHLEQLRDDVQCFCRTREISASALPCNFHEVFKALARMEEALALAGCEDTMARSRAETNHRLIVNLSRRVQALEDALDTACAALAGRDKPDDI